MEKALIIIPAFNEAGRVASVINGVRKNTDADIIVINDRSTDGTVAEAWNVGAIVIDFLFTLGYGAALQTGFKYTLGEGYQYVVQMDADGQRGTAYIIPLVEAVQSDEANVLIGSRFLGESDYTPVPCVVAISHLSYNKLRAYAKSNGSI